MKRLNSGLLLALILLFSACDDVLEEDISNGVITIIAPSDGTAIEGNAVQLRWSDLEGADDYRIQISTTGQFILLDSLVQNNLFNYQIDPGQYTWRVRGENFAYVSPYSFESSFSIVASLDLTNQLITLVNPENNIYLNDPSFNFSWVAISTADSYDFEILQVTGSTETSIFKEEDLVDASIVVPNGTLSDDSEYIWQVKANNSTSSTKYYRRSLFLDSQSPPAPELALPSADEMINSGTTIDFSWSFTDSGTIQSPITGTLEVSSVEDFSTISLTDTNSSGQFSGSLTSVDTYYWRVRGVDAAGNVGDYSTTRSFVIN